MARGAPPRADGALEVPRSLVRRLPGSTPARQGATQVARIAQAAVARTRFGRDALAHMVQRAAAQRGAATSAAVPAAAPDAAAALGTNVPMRERVTVDARHALDRARQEVERERGLFDWVTEPRLVDEAVFRLRAAEIRLDNLLHALDGRARGAEDRRAL